MKLLLVCCFTLFVAGCNHRSSEPAVLKIVDGSNSNSSSTPNKTIDAYPHAMSDSPSQK